ncbi:hypothetical protein M5D96_012978, partial [Drosophila gunungcola]
MESNIKELTGTITFTYAFAFASTLTSPRKLADLAVNHTNRPHNHLANA